MRWISVFLILLLSFATAFAQNRRNYANLDDQAAVDSGAGTPGWGSCTGASCAGGVNSATAFSTSLVGSPSTDGQSRQFFIYAQQPYSNVLWWYKLGLASTATRFRLDLRFYIDQNAVTNVQAFEFDTFQNINSRQFVYGLQCNLGSKTWDVWNGGAGQWVPTQLACTGFAPGRWHRLVLNYHRNSDTSVNYDSLTLDGVSGTLNYREPSVPLPAGWTNNLGVQFQLDTGATGGQATMWVDDVNLTTWQ